MTLGDARDHFSDHEIIPPISILVKAATARLRAERQIAREAFAYLPPESSSSVGTLGLTPSESPMISCKQRA